ncbi:hypothetical protein C1X65_04270 [Pseudomonas sp. FW305-70]|nr:hypothetical protein C1X65_04270 [Pseudomonas sp. FW305-70]
MRRKCRNSVGASLLAMNLRTLRGVRLAALSLATIASKLAPTGGFVRVSCLRGDRRGQTSRSG